MEDIEKNYEELVADLERLVAEIENPSKGLGEVSKDVSSAMELLALCRKKLRESEEDIRKSLVEEQ